MFVFNNNFIQLRATDHSKNIDRDYELHLDKGLFNSMIVLVGWGRHNTKGQQKAYYFDSKKDALSFMNQKIKKRLSSRSRIGCEYKIIQQS